MSMNYTQTAKKLKLAAANLLASGITKFRLDNGLCSYFTDQIDDDCYPFMLSIIGGKQYLAYIEPLGEFGPRRKAVVAIIAKTSVRTLRRWLSEADKNHSNNLQACRLHQHNAPKRAFRFLLK